MIENREINLENLQEKVDWEKLTMEQQYKRAAAIRRDYYHKHNLPYPEKLERVFRMLTLEQFTKQKEIEYANYANGIFNPNVEV